MNKRELRAAMALHGDTQETLAEALCLSRTWLASKINGRYGAEFNKLEILGVKVRYNLEDTQIEKIFFTA